MQVFIVGSPLETAKKLDKRRLNKQIIECEQILDAMSGKKAWSNHPCVLQYKNHEPWLKRYYWCLDYYKKGMFNAASLLDYMASLITPDFHTEDYFNQMKRRLYTKDNEHYKQWSYLGESEENWYYVDDEWLKYINGKKDINNWEE